MTAPTHRQLMVGDECLSDALGQIRHKSRLLTMAIVGLCESPHDVQDSYGKSKNHRDQNWAHDVSGIAFDLTRDIEKIIEAIDDDDEKREAQS